MGNHKHSSRFMADPSTELPVTAANFGRHQDEVRNYTAGEKLFVY
jgi:hypothetical protein